MSGPSDITLFFGRLHPLLVHLPIGLIVLLAILETMAFSTRFRNANASTHFILALAVPLATLTALCGWLLSRGGSYGDQLLQWHKWTGIGTAAGCAVAALCYSLNFKRSYRACLGMTIVALIVASHFGGSLTHGSDYLVRYAPGPVRRVFGITSATEAAIKKSTNIAELQVFADLVQPVLQQNCVSCHGPEKSESGLRLDSFEAVLKGGKSGTAVAAGKSAESSLIKRLLLPLHEKEHMPPEGKPQPEPDQVTLMRWWIDAGAPPQQKIGQLKTPARIWRTLQARYGDPAALAKKVPPKPLRVIQPLLGKLADDLNIEVTVLSPGEPWLQCNARMAGTNFGDAELARLAPLSSNFRWLDLAGTRVSDAGLAQLEGMPNLVRLHLERTPITDVGLTHLKGLAELEYLNLYSTGVTDAGLEQLHVLSGLKQLYLWQTKVTPAAAAGLTEALRDDEQTQLLQAQIEQLKARLKREHVSIELGVPAGKSSSTNSSGLNAKVPGE
jgi:uncharacterized membrane protein/mono/diheme cytochrome c family protein